MFFFFFSSRRRHTRFSRDWSSDVCSSDLAGCNRGGSAVGVDCRRRGRGAGGVLAMRDLEVAVRGVVVADQAEPVRTDCDRAPAADIAFVVEYRHCRGSADEVSAMRDLEDTVLPVVAGDETESVSADPD